MRHHAPAARFAGPRIARQRAMAPMFDAGPASLERRAAFEGRHVAPGRRALPRPAPRRGEAA